MNDSKTYYSIYSCFIENANMNWYKLIHYIDLLFWKVTIEKQRDVDTYICQSDTIGELYDNDACRVL